jgi:hypothetical protein
MQDDDFEALLRRAVDMPTDEAALKRALQARMAGEGRIKPRFDAGRWLSPQVVAACAVATFVLASAAGYGAASRVETEYAEIALLRLATGLPEAGLLDTRDILGDDAL